MLRRLALLALLALVALTVASRAEAQECRLTCRLDETRDANGCCVPAATVTPPATNPATPAPLPRRCPSGTTWADHEHGCVGHVVCPEGSRVLPGGGCESQLVACPPGTRHEDDRCVADITCPPDTRRVDSACIADVTCPAATTLESGRCVSHEVTCPQGTRREGEGLCIGRPICPANTHFSENRGCVGDLVCPEGTHLDAGSCVPEVVCPDGFRFQRGPGCVALCASYQHAHWETDRHACACDAGFSAAGGRCEPHVVCPAGTSRVGDACQGDVVCPAGSVFHRGSGCVDVAAQREAERQAAEVRAQAAHDRAVRWAEGPALQPWVGGGYGLLHMEGAYTHAGSAVNADWSGFSPSAGVDFSSQGFVVGASYSYVPALGTTLGTGETLTHNPLHLLMAEIGVQGAWPRFTLRVMLAGGYDFGGNGVPGAASVRGLFRIVGGLFVGVDVRAMLLWRVDSSFVGGEQIGGADVTGESNALLGYGGAAYAVVGYSIY